MLTLPLRKNVIVGVKLERPAVSRTLAIIRHTGRTLSPAAVAFSAMLMEAGKGS